MLFDLVTQALLYGGGKLLDKAAGKAADRTVDSAWSGFKALVRRKYPQIDVDLVDHVGTAPGALETLSNQVETAGADGDPELVAEAERIRTLSGLLMEVGRPVYPQDFPKNLRNNIEALKGPFPTAYARAVENATSVCERRAMVVVLQGSLKDLVYENLTPMEAKLKLSLHLMLTIEEQRFAYLVVAGGLLEQIERANDDIKAARLGGTAGMRRLDARDFGYGLFADDVFAEGFRLANTYHGLVAQRQEALKKSQQANETLKKTDPG